MAVTILSSRMCSIVYRILDGERPLVHLLHGDSEYAMKSFSLQAGMLLACYYHLERRLSLQTQEPKNIAQATESTSPHGECETPVVSFL